MMKWEVVEGVVIERLWGAIPQGLKWEAELHSLGGELYKLGEVI